MTYPTVDGFTVPFKDFFYDFSKTNSILNFGSESRKAAISQVKKFNHVIDIGAHIGISVTHWANHFSKVTAIEPMLDHYQCLLLNTANLTNVTHVNCAISDKDSVMLGAYRTNKNSGSFQLLDSTYRQPSKKAPRKIYEISSRRLDSFTFDYVDLIKIDVEGWELNVLQGAIDTINKFRPVLMIEKLSEEKSNKSLHRYNDTDYQKLIKDINYKEIVSIDDDIIYIPRETIK
jgi:FkbM family methyltransferase